jgi:hypothetical protein
MPRAGSRAAGAAGAEADAADAAAAAPSAPNFIASAVPGASGHVQEDPVAAGAPLAPPGVRGIGVQDLQNADDVTAAVQGAMQQAVAGVLAGGLNRILERLDALEQRAAAPAAGAGGGGAAAERPRCSLPGCTAFCFMETRPDGTTETHAFCRHSHALQFDRQMAQAAGDGGGGGDDSGDDDDGGNSSGDGGDRPRSVAASAVDSEAGMDLRREDDDARLPRLLRDDDDARGSTFSGFSAMGQQSAGPYYQPRHVLVGRDGKLYNWVSRKLQDMVQSSRNDAPQQAMLTDIIVANEMFNQVQYEAARADEDTRRRYRDFFALLRCATDRLTLCVDAHVVHPLNTGVRADALVLRRILDPRGDEVDLYFRQEAREIIQERMYKDADNSAKKVTNADREDARGQQSRRGTRGSGNGGSGTNGSRNGGRSSGVGTGRGSGGGGSGGGGGGRGNDARSSGNAGAARGASQERGRQGARGGADGASRANQ